MCYLFWQNLNAYDRPRCHVLSSWVGFFVNIISFCTFFYELLLLTHPEELLDVGTKGWRASTLLWNRKRLLWNKSDVKIRFTSKYEKPAIKRHFFFLQVWIVTQIQKTCYPVPSSKIIWYLKISPNPASVIWDKFSFTSKCNPVTFRPSLVYVFKICKYLLAERQNLYDQINNPSNWI